MIDLSKTLNQLERNPGGGVPYPSYLVTTCHRLRQKPLREFTLEDLRIMIGQNIGLNFLVPLAMNHLEKNPLAEGDFYPGDLLHAVLTVESVFWDQHTDLRRQAAKAVERARKRAEQQRDEVVNKALAEAFQIFQASAKRSAP